MLRYPDFEKMEQVFKDGLMVVRSEFKPVDIKTAVYAMFPQTLPDEFMDEIYTVVMHAEIISEMGFTSFAYGVFFDGKLAYINTHPNYHFIEDINRHHLESTKNWRKRYE